MRNLRIGIILDYDMYQEEFEQAAWMHRQLLNACEEIGLEVSLQLVTYGCSPIILDDAGHLDLVLIDYGGMSVHGAHDGAVSGIRYTVNYAQDHPGTLLIIWTPFTRYIYEGELKKEFGDLSNVLCRYDEFEKVKDYQDFLHKLAIWIGK